MLRLRTLGIAALALAAAGMCAGRLLADDTPEKPKPQPRPAMQMRPVGTLEIILTEKVQKELDVTDKQLESLKKFGEDSRADLRKLMEGMRDLSPEDRRAKLDELRPKMDDLRKDAEKKINEVLDEKQRDRLKQIGLQLRGAGALAQNDVADALKITDEQKAKLKAVWDKQADAMKDLRAGRDGRRDKMKAIAKESLEKSLDVLTTEQKKKLEEMEGKKVDFDMFDIGLGGGRGGFGGRGHGRGPGGGAPPAKSSDKPV